MALVADIGAYGGHIGAGEMPPPALRAEREHMAQRPVKMKHKIRQLRNLGKGVRRGILGKLPLVRGRLRCGEQDAVYCEPIRVLSAM